MNSSTYSEGSSTLMDTSSSASSIAFVASLSREASRAPTPCPSESGGGVPNSANKKMETSPSPQPPAAIIAMLSVPDGSAAGTWTSGGQGAMTTSVGSRLPVDSLLLDGRARQGSLANISAAAREAAMHGGSRGGASPPSAAALRVAEVPLGSPKSNPPALINTAVEAKRPAVPNKRYVAGKQRVPSPPNRIPTPPPKRFASPSVTFRQPIPPPLSSSSGLAPLLSSDSQRSQHQEPRLSDYGSAFDTTPHTTWGGGGDVLSRTPSFLVPQREILEAPAVGSVDLSQISGGGGSVGGDRTSAVSSLGWKREKSPSRRLKVVKKRMGSPGKTDDQPVANPSEKGKRAATGAAGAAGDTAPNSAVQGSATSNQRPSLRSSQSNSAAVSELVSLVSPTTPQITRSPTHISAAIMTTTDRNAAGSIAKGVAAKEALSFTRKDSDSLVFASEEVGGVGPRAYPSPTLSSASSPLQSSRGSSQKTVVKVRRMKSVPRTSSPSSSPKQAQVPPSPFFVPSSVASFSSADVEQPKHTQILQQQQQHNQQQQQYSAKGEGKRGPQGWGEVAAPQDESTCAAVAPPSDAFRLVNAMRSTHNRVRVTEASRTVPPSPIEPTMEQKQRSDGRREEELHTAGNREPRAGNSDVTYTYTNSNEEEGHGDRERTSYRSEKESHGMALSPEERPQEGAREEQKRRRDDIIRREQARQFNRSPQRRSINTALDTGWPTPPLPAEGETKSAGGVVAVVQSNPRGTLTQSMNVPQLRTSRPPPRESPFRSPMVKSPPLPPPPLFSANPFHSLLSMERGVSVGNPHDNNNTSTTTANTNTNSNTHINAPPAEWDAVQVSALTQPGESDHSVPMNSPAIRLSNGLDRDYGHTRQLSSSRGRSFTEPLEKNIFEVEDALEDAEDQKELLRLQLRAAGDHLQRLTRMYNMLNEHNDGIEVEFIRIRSVVDTLRLGVADSLKGAVLALRRDQERMRDRTVDDLAMFYRDMQTMLLKVVSSVHTPRDESLRPTVRSHTSLNGVRLQPLKVSAAPSSDTDRTKPREASEEDNRKSAASHMVNASQSSSSSSSRSAVFTRLEEGTSALRPIEKTIHPTQANGLDTSSLVNMSFVDANALESMMLSRMDNERKTNAKIDKIRQRKRQLEFHCKSLKEDLVASQLEADGLREQLRLRDRDFSLYLRDVKHSYMEQLATCEDHIKNLVRYIDTMSSSSSGGANQLASGKDRAMTANGGGDKVPLRDWAGESTGTGSSSVPFVLLRNASATQAPLTRGAGVHSSLSVSSSMAPDSPEPYTHAAGDPTTQRESALLQTGPQQKEKRGEGALFEYAAAVSYNTEEALLKGTRRLLNNLAEARQSMVFSGGNDSFSGTQSSAGHGVSTKWHPKGLHTFARVASHGSRANFNQSNHDHSSLSYSSHARSSRIGTSKSKILRQGDWAERMLKTHNQKVPTIVVSDGGPLLHDSTAVWGNSHLSTYQQQPLLLDSSTISNPSGHHSFGLSLLYMDKKTGRRKTTDSSRSGGHSVPRSARGLSSGEVEMQSNDPNASAPPLVNYTRALTSAERATVLARRGYRVGDNEANDTSSTSTASESDGSFPSTVEGNSDNLNANISAYSDATPPRKGKDYLQKDEGYSPAEASSGPSYARARPRGGGGGGGGERREARSYSTVLTSQRDIDGGLVDTQQRWAAQPNTTYGNSGVVLGHFKKAGTATILDFEGNAYRSGSAAAAESFVSDAVDELVAVQHDKAVRGEMITPQNKSVHDPPLYRRPTVSSLKSAVVSPSAPQPPALGLTKKKPMRL